MIKVTITNTLIPAHNTFNAADDIWKNDHLLF